MSYEINPHYEVSKGVFYDIRKNDDYNCLMINLKVSYYNQNYPPCRTTGGYEQQLQYLKEVFEVQNEQDLIGKECVVLNSHCDMFCIFNPENNRFFSLHAKFFPEKYEEALKQVKTKQDNEVLEQLDDFNALMMGVVMAQKNQSAEVLILSKVIQTGQLKKKLEAKFTPTFKEKTKKI